METMYIVKFFNSTVLKANRQLYVCMCFNIHLCPFDICHYILVLIKKLHQIGKSQTGEL